MPQPLSAFAAGDFPLSVAVALDRSFSMSGRAWRSPARPRRVFLGELRPADEVGHPRDRIPGRDRGALVDRSRARIRGARPARRLRHDRAIRFGQRGDRADAEGEGPPGAGAAVGRRAIATAQRRPTRRSRRHAPTSWSIRSRSAPAVTVLRAARVDDWRAGFPSSDPRLLNDTMRRSRASCASSICSATLRPDRRRPGRVARHEARHREACARWVQGPVTATSGTDSRPSGFAGSHLDHQTAFERRQQPPAKAAVRLFAGDEIRHDVPNPAAGLQRVHQQRDERRPEEARLDRAAAAARRGCRRGSGHRRRTFRRREQAVGSQVGGADGEVDAFASDGIDQPRGITRSIQSCPAGRSRASAASVSEGSARRSARERGHREPRAQSSLGRRRAGPAWSTGRPARRRRRPGDPGAGTTTGIPLSHRRTRCRWWSTRRHVRRSRSRFRGRPRPNGLGHPSAPTRLPGPSAPISQLALDVGCAPSRSRAARQF